VVSEPTGEGGVPGLARSLRDAGMEVIYTGPGQTPEQIVQTALQEDADVIGLALGAGAPSAGSTRLAELVELLTQRDAEDVLVFATGPDGAATPDGASGSAGTAGPGSPEEHVGATVFAPNTRPSEIVAWIRDRSGSP
jgi:methylmalonyl-CoA mutase C-terminal domain/subunit